MSEEVSSGVLEFFVRLNDQFSAPLTEAQERIESFKQSLAGIAVGFAEAFSGYEVIENIIDPAIQMQALMNQIQIATHASNEEMERAKDVAMEWSTIYGQSAESILGGMMQLEKYTGSLTTAMQVLPSAIELAAGAHIDLAQAISMVGAAYNDMNNPALTAAQNAQQIADLQTILLTLYPRSAAGMAQATRDQARAAAAAKTYHIAYDQILAVLGLINKTGLAGQRGSGSIVDQLINSLFKLDKHGIPALEKYHLKIAKTADGNIDLIKTLQLIQSAGPAALDALAQSIGIPGQQLSLFMGLVDQLPATVANFKNSAGAAAAAAGKSTNTFQTQFANLQNAISNLRDSLSLQLLPAVTKIVEGMTAFMVMFNNFAMAHPTLTDIFGWAVLSFAGLMMLNGVLLMTISTLRMVVAVGGLLTYIIPAIMRVKSAVETLYISWLYLQDAVAVGGIAALLPFIEIIAVLALVGVAVYLLLTKWKDFKLGIEVIYGWLKSASKDVWLFVQMNFTNTVNAMIMVWNGFVAILKAIDTVIQPIVAAFEKAYAAVSGMAKALGITGPTSGGSAPPTGRHGRFDFGVDQGGGSTSSTATAPITQNNHISIVMPSGATVSDTKTAVVSALKEHGQTLADQMKKAADNAARLNFGDSRWAES